MTAFIKAFENRLPTELTFGLYFGDHPMMKDSQYRSLGMLHNFGNVCDWFLLTSVISGLARGIFLAFLAVNYFSDGGKKDRSFEVWLFMESVRSVVSFLGGGFLWIVPDILFAINEGIKQHIGYKASVV